MVVLCVLTLNMFSKCVFPVASSPFHKFACVTVGAFVTGSGVGATCYGFNKLREYMDRLPIPEPKKPMSEPKSELKSQPEPVIIYRDREPKIDYFGIFAQYTLMSPFQKTTDPKLIVSSVPFTGLYCLGQGIMMKGWYDVMKYSFVNIKSTDQCCKLVRMSIAGSVLHSSIAATILSWGYITGIAVHNTYLNTYSTVTGIKK